MTSTQQQEPCKKHGQARIKSMEAPRFGSCLVALVQLCQSILRHLSPLTHWTSGRSVDMLGAARSSGRDRLQLKLGLHRHVHGVVEEQHGVMHRWVRQNGFDFHCKSGSVIDFQPSEFAESVDKCCVFPGRRGLQVQGDVVLRKRLLRWTLIEAPKIATSGHGERVLACNRFAHAHM